MRRDLFISKAGATLTSQVPVCALAIDAEEDFDWTSPLRSTQFSTECMKNIGTLHEILGAYRAVPTYLLTYPVLEDGYAVNILKRKLAAGQCRLGLQLHTWVTPPFEGGSDLRSSFAGNLSGDLEERKLVALKDKFVSVFGVEPRVYRAGRYGLSCLTASLLEKHGFTVDTSIAPRTNFASDGGPDYYGYDYAPFWFGRARNLLELPLCRSVVGWAGACAPRLYKTLTGRHLAQRTALGMLTRLRCAERITLSPEGNDLPAMRRLVSRLLEQGSRVLALSFHSSSLAIGHNPYVQSKADLHIFYDRLSGILDFMSRRLSCEFASVEEIPRFLDEPSGGRAPV